jgi:hypothetical protein
VLKEDTEVSSRNPAGRRVVLKRLFISIEGLIEASYMSNVLLVR